LKAYLKNTNLSYEVLHQTDERFTYNLELAIRFGKILIIEDVGHHFLPPLLSVISMRIHSRFNKKMLHVGNKFIDLHENFKLIMLSSMVIKSLNGDVNANITLMPFTLTISGLTDQLLSKWISIKNPEMEMKRIELLEEEGRLIKQKIEFQDKLLEELSHAEGDILKNEVCNLKINGSVPSQIYL
jgi:dynein heavy chain 2